MMKGGIGNMMKQAQQLQTRMQQAQAEIAAMEVTGESGGGMVKVTINGRHEAKRVQIDPSVPLDDREMIEDLVAAAINDAVHRLETTSQEKIAGPAGGQKMPPGPQRPHSRARPPATLFPRPLPPPTVACPPPFVVAAVTRLWHE